MGFRTGRLADRRRDADLPAHRRGGGRLSRRRVPERLDGLVDSHAHLQDARFDEDREAVLDRAGAAGIERILVPGWDLASSEAALELAATHNPMIQAAVGVHPHDAAGTDEAAWTRLEGLAADPVCVAIGEIGLDYARVLSPPEAQREAFRRQLAIADRLGKPVLVHDREAHADVTGALLGRSGRGVLHAFSGDATMAITLAAAGYILSFALPVAFRSAIGPRAAAASLPDGSLLVETDSPYLGPARDRRNEPTTALRVVAEVARLRQTEPETLAVAMRGAFDRLFAG